MRCSEYHWKGTGFALSLSKIPVRPYKALLVPFRYTDKGRWSRGPFLGLLEATQSVANLHKMYQYDTLHKKQGCDTKVHGPMAWFLREELLQLAAGRGAINAGVIVNNPLRGLFFGSTPVLLCNIS